MAFLLARGLRPRLRWLSVALAFGMVAVPSASAAGAPLWPAASELTLPANASTTPGSQVATIGGLSCASAGNCVAAGSYADSTGAQQAMVATETNGTWGQANELTLPANADMTASQDATIDGVNCTSAGNCVAAGSYADSTGAQEAMVATETNGTWGQANEITLPANADMTASQDATIDGVSCTSAGNCVAAGSYADSSDAFQAMIATETSGTWGQASELTLPANANTAAGSQGAAIGGVNCTSTGNCVAGGHYMDSSGATQAMVATETSGTWGQASELTLPANANTTAGSQVAGLDGITCTAAGDCVAGGLYVDSTGAQQAMAATETNGSWGQAAELALPANASTASGSQVAAIGGVSCTSAGNCVAAGSYADSTDAFQAMVATETSGSWGQAAELALPANASTSSDQFALLDGVSCTSAGGCAAGGHYVDSSGSTQAMVVSSAGALSVASAALPSGMVASAYHGQLTATGGSGSYTWSVVAGQLPTGLSLSSSGVISGTPTAAGTQTFEVQVSDPGPPAQQATATVSITVNPAAPRTVVATFGNQRITVTIPPGCAAPASGLAVSFASTRRARGAKLRFERVAFYLDRGVKHKVRKRVGGKRKLVTVYLPNAIRVHQPVTVMLSVAKLGAGTNTLRVVASYAKVVRAHGHKKTVTVTKTLRIKFTRC